MVTEAMKLKDVRSLERKLSNLVLSYSVLTNCLRLHGLHPARLLCLWGSPGKTTEVGCHALLQGMACHGMSNLDSILKGREITLPTNVHIVKVTLFWVAMYGCESCTMKAEGLNNLCLPFVVLEKSLESSLDCKEIKPVNHKGNKPWIFIGSCCCC